MKITRLGNSDLKVSRICLGCMGFGDATRGQHSWTLNEADSRAVIRRALDSGINFFDTAIVYQGGTSEQYLGRALRDFARRDEVVIATKFPVRSAQEIEAGVSGQRHVREMLDRSLQNLGVDYVDLYIYHMWDYRTPLYEIMEGLNEAVRSGKARYIGISNCFAWQLCQPNDAFARYFSGKSYLAQLSGEQVGVCNVTFEPGCRNNWHIHHAVQGGGQILICVAGRGYYQQEGQPARLLTPGDVVNIPAEVRHWHGAAPDSWMSHLAIEVPGVNASNEWLEPVDDATYAALG